MQMCMDGIISSDSNSGLVKTGVMPVFLGING
jgi:hypothetical protein